MAPKKMRRRSFIFLTLAASLFATGCGGGADKATDGSSGDAAETKRIIILTNGPDPFWDTCEAGAKAAEKELKLGDANLKVDFQRGDFTDKKQIDMLKQYVLASDVAAVGVSVFNPNSRNLVAEMQTLQEKGVKVITIDSDVNRDKFRDARFGYLGTDNIIGGTELGRAAKAISPDGANFAFFVGDLGVANAKERMQGFINGSEGANFRELDRLSDGGDRPKARKNTEDTLDRHKDCNMLVGIWAYNTPQIINVLKARNLREKTKVICFDAAQNSIKGMGDGNVDVMVVQNPYQMGFEGVTLMKALIEDDQAAVSKMYPDYKKEGEGDLYRTQLRVVVPDEGSPVTKDLFGDNTIFFKYSDFKKWLGERNLISS